MKLGERLAKGRTADIYRWNDKEVLKLYQPRVLRGSVERERCNTRVARSMGLPAPYVGDIIMLEGRFGLIMEWVDGHTMMEQLGPNTSVIVTYARQLAELHVSLNSIVVKAGLDPQREILRGKITRCELLTASEKEAVLTLLAQMPEGDCFCHGDFHPGNILLAHGRFSIIDWIDASRGRPAADLARSSILFLGHIAHSPRFSQERRAMELFHTTYLNDYLRMTGVSMDEYARWLPIITAARLGEGITEFNDWLVSQLHQWFESVGA